LRRILTAILVLLATAPPLRAAECPAAQVTPLRLPALAAQVASGGPVTIIALGSSSTEGIGATRPEATYPAQLEAALRAALPGIPVTVLNKGVGGQDAAEMVLRLDADALAHDPSLIIWQVGTNGALRRHSPRRFAQMMADGVDIIHASGADVLLMDSQRGAWARSAPEREAFDRVLADLAERPGVALFRRGALMDAWATAGTAPETMLTGDGLHHNDRGYACLAQSVAQDILAGLPTRSPGPGALANRAR
jgi:lysophospholipase L1-like esterase